MAHSDKEKSLGIERDRKIKKLTKMIKAKVREIDLIEVKADRAKVQVTKGDLSKGDYQRLNIQLARDRKAVRGAITRLEKSRLNRERKIKEDLIKKEEKVAEKAERLEQRNLEKEHRKEEKVAKKDTSEKDGD